METLSLVTLLVVGLAVAGALAYVIGAPLFAIVKDRRQSSKLKKAADRLEEVDGLIAERKFPVALKILKQLIIFDPVEHPKSVESVREHHQNVLTRCLIISEELGSRAENLAEVERLFIQRSELQTLLIKAGDSFRSLQERREQAGKDIPQWSKSDFEQRLKDIRAELDANQVLLTKAADQLFSALESPRSEGIIYH